MPFARSRAAYQIVREWRDLLKTADGDILDATSITLLDKLIIDLTSAKNVTTDLLGFNETFPRFRNVSLERSLASHFVEVGASFRGTQKRLGEENDKLCGSKMSVSGFGFQKSS